MSNYKLMQMEPTAEMVEAAEDAYMPFGDMDLAIRMAVLTAPAVQGEPVAVLLFDEPERTERGLELGDWDIAPNATAIEAFAKLAKPGAYQLYLAPQPAPDVVGLVDALEQCTTSMLDSGYRADAVVIRAARSALAAHRKGGGGE